MKRKILTLVSAFLMSNLIYAQDMNIVAGWQMKGTEVGFSNIQSFNKSCIDTVWSFDTSSNSWKAYSPDGELAKLIEKSSTISNLTSLNKDDGFWVKANSNCLVSKDTNLSNAIPTVIYQANALWPYSTPFTLDMIANKTFKYDSNGDHTMTFDVNGFNNDLNGFNNSGVLSAVSTIGGCSSDLTYESNTSINSAGILVYQWHHTYKNIDTNTTESNFGQNEQKVLATNSDIGHIVVSRNYNNHSMQFHEYVSSMIFDTAEENPVDMSTKLPYTTFSSWDLENKNSIRYNTNGTIEHFNKDGIQNNYNDENFTIENGRIVTTYDYNSTDNESHNIESKQIVFNIGDYDILKIVGTGNNKDFQVSYNDINNSWISVDLNSSVKTFYDLFKLTNNKLYDGVYDLDTGTITSTYSCDLNQSFTISNDGKTLTTCWSNKYCDDRTIENGAIVSEYSYDYYETIKTTPYF